MDWDVITDIDEYVHREDGAFSWYEVASYNYDNVTLYLINMTSQQYQTEEYSTRTIWWHWVGIAVPDTIKYRNHAMMYITGGNNDDLNVPPIDEQLNRITVALATDMNMVTAYIRQVPNQPIYFYDDPDFKRRSEDSFIAWTWRSFHNSPEPSDPTVIARMPMTKSAKRALDTITEFTQWRAPDTDIQQFFVSGGSKRGWTTWSLAATDRRIAGIVPIVFSQINMNEGLLNHQRNMDGGWSFVFNDYWNENLTLEVLHPKSQRVWEVEDMWYYRERFTMPYYPISATGDEFFLVDDNHVWWDDFPDPKHFMMVPNAEHSMAPQYLRCFEATVSWLTHIIEDIPLPSVTWTMGNTTEGGWIRFVANPPPVSIRVMSAITLPNNTRRDFRFFEGPPAAFQPIFWTEQIEAVDMGDGVYLAEAENVPGLWHGFFVEGTWAGPTGYRMIFTSQVNIIPWTYPREACTDPESCYGYLV